MVNVKRKGSPRGGPQIGQTSALKVHLPGSGPLVAQRQDWPRGDLFQQEPLILSRKRTAAFI